MALSKLPRHRHGQVLAGVVALLLFFLAGCGGPNPVTVPTPTTPAIQFTVIDLKLPAEALNAQVIGSVPDDTILHVSVTFKTNQQTLDQLNQKKVQTGQNQDLEGLANKLGITDQQYQQFKSFFGIENATLKLNKLHTNLTVDAKAKTFARLFQTHFVIHKLNGRTFFTPAANAPPKLPKFIADQIVAITGLDNYSVAPQRALQVLQHSDSVYMGARKSPAATCTPPNDVLSVPEIDHLYGYDQFYKAGFHGEGMTINLIEIDGLATSDLQTYLRCANYRGRISLVTIRKAPSPGLEATLDVEMIASAAPSANMVVYQTDISQAQTFNDFWTALNDELQQLINDNTKNGGTGSVVSISLGAPEGALTQDNVTAIDQSLEILTKGEHMTVFIASGDCGAFGIGDLAPNSFGQLAVSYPSTDPWAVSVGGIEPQPSQNGIVQVAWSNGSNRSKCDHQWGSGGGLSQVFQIPSWQAGPGVKNKFSNGMRQVPDVAAFAIPIACFVQSAWGTCLGTSLATPVWASGMALVNQALIHQTHSFFFGPSLIYGVAQTAASNNESPYFEVTRGNNLYYPATPGWNFATGFGAPNLPVFYNILLAAAKQ